MQRVELLTVRDTFWLNRNGEQKLILQPNFSVPEGWKEQGLSERSQKVVVLKPDGQQIDATAQLDMTHLNIRDPMLASTREGGLPCG